MPENEFYVRSKGRIAGPFTVEMLQKLVRRGTIARVDEVSSDRVSWARAAEYEELFPAPKAAVPLPPPMMPVNPEPNHNTYEVQTPVVGRNPLPPQRADNASRYQPAGDSSQIDEKKSKRIPVFVWIILAVVLVLIIVPSLCIVSAITIPQFMNASSENAVSSTQTTLSTVRAQIELFKLQHNDTYPGLAASTNGTTAWAPMLIKTDSLTTSGTTAVATGTYGPYFTVPPINTLNQKSGIVIADFDSPYPKANANAGWVWDSTNAKIKAIVPAAWASGKVPYATGGTTLDTKYVGDFTKE